MTIGWETTLACNMRCKHCGSDAGTKRANELDTAQALELCRQLDAFPEPHVTLTGGETFIRPDWPEIVAELVKRRRYLGIISNAWYVDADMAAQLKRLQGPDGLINLGLSLDGDRELHDEIRKPESYDRVLAALDHLREVGIYASIITVVNPKNIHCLDHVRDLALAHGAYAWQIQVTSEYGRAAEDGSLILDRDHYRRVGEKMVQYRRELEGGSCRVYSADCMGYFGALERDLRTRPWHGCHAGIRCLGVMSNGDVKGCLSLLEEVFVEGNILETPLAEIWEKPGAFGYNRDFTADMLTGPCGRCRYGYICRGGCHSTGYSILGTVNEAPYCLYAEERGWFDGPVVRRDKEVESLVELGGNPREINVGA